jgi:hypothetical protein
MPRSPPLHRHPRSLVTDTGKESPVARSAQLAYMLEGIDWRHPQRTWQPEAVG